MKLVLIALTGLMLMGSCAHHSASADKSCTECSKDSASCSDCKEKEKKGCTDCESKSEAKPEAKPETKKAKK